MIESLRKTLLASIGMVSFTKDRLQALFAEMVERGELSQEQSRGILEKLLHRGESQEDQRLISRLLEELDRMLSKGPLVTRAEFRRLKGRVDTLEGGGTGASSSPHEGAEGPEAESAPAASGSSSA